MKIGFILISILFLSTLSAQVDENNKASSTEGQIKVDASQEGQTVSKIQDKIADVPVEQIKEIIKESTKNNENDPGTDNDAFDLEAFLDELLEDVGEEDLPELFGYLEKMFGEQGEEEEGEEFEEGEETEEEEDLYELPDIISEWPELLQDFSPDDMIAFELESGEIETLYQTIDLPTTVKGAFFLPFYPESNQIDFQIQSLDNDVIYHVEDVQDHIFAVNITKAGEYKFVFHNQGSEDTYMVNFALDAHSSRLGHLKQKDLDPFSRRLENIHNAMRDNYFENKFTQARQETGYSYLAQTHNKLLFFTVLETFGVVAINIWQIFYIKRILENRRLI